jgi:hypothetical protein
MRTVCWYLGSSAPVRGAVVDKEAHLAHVLSLPERPGASTTARRVKVFAGLAEGGHDARPGFAGKSITQSQWAGGGWEFCNRGDR